MVLYTKLSDTTKNVLLGFYNRPIGLHFRPSLSFLKLEAIDVQYVVITYQTFSLVYVVGLREVLPNSKPLFEQT